MAKTTTEYLKLEIEDMDEFISNEYINRNFQKIDQSAKNLVAPETKALYEEMGIKFE